MIILENEEKRVHKFEVMNCLLYPGYFLNIANFVAIANNKICWEVMGNFQKQTSRNRCYIHTDQGKHMLSIPVKHVGNKGKQKYCEVQIDNDYPWQRQHWRTLETAYRSSAFFEFYEDEISLLYHKIFDNLMEFNLATLECICNCLQIEMPAIKTSVYEKEITNAIDARFLIQAKYKPKFNQKEYFQVFKDRNGFIENLSVLDLLFNEGTNALSYLKEHKITFTNA